MVRPPFLFQGDTMTPRTSLHKISHNNTTILFRDLSVQEVLFLSNIKADVMKHDLAAKTCIIEPTDLTNIPWPILQQIGQSTINHSTKWVNDKQLFEILVKEYRKDILDGTSPLGMIKKIIEVFPGQSITELLKLTFKDLVELVCLAEQVTGKKILNVAGGPVPRRKGSRLANAQVLEGEDGQSLQDKMNALNASLGGIPK